MAKIVGTLAVMLAFLLIGVTSVTSTSANGISVSAGCSPTGVVGTITGTTAGQTLDIWVTDHVPSQGYWVEVPGSRVTITATGSSVAFGPLGVNEVRSDANSIRVEQSLSPAKSLSFPPCEGSTPTPVVTPTPTATPLVTTPTPTLIPPETATPRPTETPKTVLTATPTPAPETPSALPPTGGPEEAEKNDNIWFWLVVMSILAVSTGFVLYKEATRIGLI